MVHPPRQAVGDEPWGYRDEPSDRGTRLGYHRGMSIDTRALWRWYRPRRGTFEWGFWIALYGLNAAANSVVRVLEIEPGDATAAWEPVVWECSSALAMLLLVWPVVVFTRH